EVPNSSRRSSLAVRTWGETEFSRNMFRAVERLKQDVEGRFASEAGLRSEAKIPAIQEVPNSSRRSSLAVRTWGDKRVLL
ncbi:MAG TPA: hypothetical protein VHA13_05465, partial [Gammaproteobacteria bacterium]|nr:hypothetical protein [Gammaproteobacteria bacterium]